MLLTLTQQSRSKEMKKKSSHHSNAWQRKARKDPSKKANLNIHWVNDPKTCLLGLSSETLSKDSIINLMVRGSLTLMKIRPLNVSKKPTSDSMMSLKGLNHLSSSSTCSATPKRSSSWWTKSKAGSRITSTLLRSRLIMSKTYASPASSSR